MTTRQTSPTSFEDWRKQRLRDADPHLSLAVWCWTISDGVGDDRCLSDDERKRSEKMNKLAGSRFLLHRSRTRQILAHHLDCTAESIRFRYSQLGRPALDSRYSGLDFNLSHSGDHGVLAVSRIGDVGVDIERFRSLPDYLAIARRVWPADWSANLAETAEIERQQRFFEYWTRFEACQKAQGGGVFSYTPCEDSPVLRFSLASDCVGHLCLAVSEANFPKVGWFRLIDHD